MAEDAREPATVRVGFIHRHRGLTPYLLLVPGLVWLAVFFLVPLGFLAYQSLADRNPFDFSLRVHVGLHELLGLDLDLPRQLVRRSSTRRSRR